MTTLVDISGVTFIVQVCTSSTPFSTLSTWINGPAHAVSVNGLVEIAQPKKNVIKMICDE